MRGESRLYTMAYVISNNYNLDKTIMYMQQGIGSFWEG